MSRPFGDNPPTSKLIAIGIDYTNRVSSMNRVIDKLNEWQTEFNAPFPLMLRVYETGGSHHSDWTSRMNALITASNQFFKWGYGDPATSPLPTYGSLGYGAFTAALNRVITYWDEANEPPPVVDPPETDPPVNDDPPYVTGPGGDDNQPVGATLSSTMGNWENMQGEPHSYAYQWFRQDEFSANREEIDETTANYTLVAADSGWYVLCVVTAINSAGSASEESNEISCE